MKFGEELVLEARHALELGAQLDDLAARVGERRLRGGREVLFLRGGRRVDGGLDEVGEGLSVEEGDSRGALLEGEGVDEVFRGRAGRQVELLLEVLDELGAGAREVLEAELVFVVVPVELERDLDLLVRPDAGHEELLRPATLAALILLRSLVLQVRALRSLWHAQPCSLLLPLAREIHRSA